MSNIPQWKADLLDRLPRPVAVIAIVTMDWLLDMGAIYIGAFCWLIVMPVAVVVIRQSLIDGVVVFVVNLFVSWSVLYAIVWLWDKYEQADKKLPRREKKSEDKPA